MTAPMIVPSTVQHRGKILFFTRNGKLNVFSSFTRRWTSRPVAGTPTLRIANDWLMIQDGNQVSAFSSMRGTFETISVSGAATVVNPSTQVNDSILLVLDGTTLHAFSGLIGTWTQRTVAANALISTQREVAIVAEGSTLRAMSGMVGAWMPLQSADPIVSISADGTIAVAETANEVHGFSAIRNSWSTAPVLAGSVRHMQRDVAIWNNPFECLGFSGVRGVFDRIGIGLPTRVTLGDSYGVAAAGNRTYFFFSAPLAHWLGTTLSTPATLSTREVTALLTESDRVHAYSPLTGTLATQIVPQPLVVLNATVAAAIDGGVTGLYMYSAFTGNWQAAPAGAAIAVPELARNAALLQSTSGRIAYSARTGRFVALGATGNEATYVDQSSSILAVEDGGMLHAFEPRREVWISRVLPGGVPPNVRIWRTTLVATSGSTALGFSVLHGVFETVAIPGPVADLRASSEVGTVITSDDVLAFSSIPDLTTHAQFPEFRRMFTRGISFDLHLAAEPMSAVGAVAGIPIATPLALPFGDLTLLPGALVPLPMSAVGGQGRSVLTIAVPDVAALTGVRLGFQALVLPPAGTPYLTRLGALGIY